jgi:sulfatase maturation enzyme AslB (radical SAM superfamily)
MYCPRLDHFVRFNHTGSVSRCGHMTNAPEFDSLEQMDSSEWLSQIKNQFDQDIWPKECQRCKETEQINQTSIRTHSIKFDQQQTQTDYLIVGGVLDNICNSACMTCHEGLSTKIGSLKSKHYAIVDNTKGFWSLPQDRITHLDLNGGEPSHSKNYKAVLKNLPANVRSIRLNTNCSTVLTELTELVDRGIEVTVTVSFDGIGEVHDFIRWPIKWDKFYSNLMEYKNMPVKLNLWTTVSVLNQKHLPEIIAFAQEHGIDHDYAYLKTPAVLDVNNQDQLSIDRYIQEQKQLRGIK